MLPLADTPVPPADSLAAYLLIALGGLCSVIGLLFWKLMEAKTDLVAAKAEVVSAYKEILPATTLLMSTVQALQKLIERYESRGSHDA